MKIGVGGTNRSVIANKIGIGGAWRTVKEIKMGVANAWRSVWKRAVELIRTFTTKSDFDTCTLTDTVATEAGDVELVWLEGTTNLITANQSSVETDLTGFTKNTTETVLARVTTEHWHGSACLKVSIPGLAAYEGVGVSHNVTSGITYTFSVYLKGSGVVRIVMEGVCVALLSSIELTNEWKRYSITKTAGSSGTLYLYILAENDGTSDTIYIDGLQLEQKDHVCPWTLGGTASQSGYLSTGTIESPAIDLSSAIEAETSEIEFSTTTPTGTTATVQTALSTDGGTTYGSWQTVTSGAAIPGLTAGADVGNTKLKWKAVLGTNDASVTPKLHDVTVKLNEGM